MIGKEITLNVPQGIGDIFWIYQKFAPHFQYINFNVLTISDHITQTRSDGFLDALPKVRQHYFRRVPYDLYVNVMGSKYYMPEIVSEYKKGTNEFNYSCNRWLEDGVRLDSIDNEFPIQEFVDIRLSEFESPYKEFMLVFISGTHYRKDIWNVKKWASFVKKLCAVKSRPVIIVGASYDSEVSNELNKNIIECGIDTAIYIDLPIDQVFYLIKNAKFLVGFQSGLNVIAENFNVKQCMLYFPSLMKMTNTWVKRQNIEKKIFNAAYFTSSPEQVATKIASFL